MDEPRLWSLPSSEEHSNEDAVFVRDGVAVVVDGAGLPRSMRAGCRHSVAWYSEQLACTFGEALLLPGLTMSQALGRAIVEVSKRHDGCALEEGSPSATVAAWRLQHQQQPPIVEYLVLCDASLIISTADDVMEVTDDRLALLVAEELDRVAAASTEALDAIALLNARACVLDRARNVDGGFWCCQIDPAAADQALTGSYLLADLVGVVIATDGATRGFQLLGIHTLGEFAQRAGAGGGAGLLEEVRDAERDQTQRLIGDAIKVHDDATLIALRLTGHRS